MAALKISDQVKVAREKRGGIGLGAGWSLIVIELIKFNERAHSLPVTNLSSFVCVCIYIYIHTHTHMRAC